MLLGLQITRREVESKKRALKRNQIGKDA